MSAEASEMVERVRLAIMDCEAAGPITPSAARVVARAAIEAMREPTIKMLEAAHYEKRPYKIWPLMIDAAL